jgi:hypothetical protein
LVTLQQANRRTLHGQVQSNTRDEMPEIYVC